ncbi:conserved protein of unknown function [Pseudodesulfovibrio profundus]|uniref:Uncharacterized protein n=1 Tax=Pseudodesulfovibrio profundus TaxID=57320 RepID=A0A2C8F9Z3_9BACT|nr:hypothetical protein [Pseudodesulfovibrio profundus]SOB59251.1 conserved protein of unknown function [Pseudodesulfovibrio profundus]
MTDRTKFVKLANKRVNAAIKSIKEVSELSNTSKYEYSKEDADRIIEHLQSEVDDCRKRFEIALNVDAWVQFSLDE